MMESKPAEAGPAFERDVSPTLRAVQGACAAIVEATAAAKGAQAIRKASHLQKALDIPMTLAWQVFRLATVDDPITEAETVPGSRSVQRLVRSARQQGVRDEPLESLVDSVRRFEELVKEIAGDRKTFNSIASGLKPDDTTDSMLNIRRDAFRANSKIHGASVRTRMATYIVHPSSESMADVLGLVGVVDLYRLRAGRPFTFTSTSIVGTPQQGSSFGHTLDPPDLSDRGGTVLTEFCSDPIRSIRSYISDDNRLVTELSPEDLGKRHAVDAFVAEIYRDGDQRFATESDPMFSVKMQVTMPTVIGVVDIVLADGVFGKKNPILDATMTMHRRQLPFSADRIGVDPEIEVIERPDVLYLGQGSAVLKTPDIPRYPAMFEHVCKRAGWDPGVFHTFRCRVEYPVMGSSIAVGFRKPQQA